MARPKPSILIEHVDQKTYKSEQVLKADAIYAVFFNDEPINLRNLNLIVDYPVKYKKCSYSNPAHALNLAERLNKKFKTDKFKVYKLTKGEEYIG